MNGRFFRITCLLFAFAALLPRGVDAATLQFTEIHQVPGIVPVGELPDYVEIHYTAATPFDLVVFNATGGSTGSILSVTSVTPSAADNTIVIHAGDWPAASPFNGQRVRDDELTLGEFHFGVRLVLFDGPSGLSSDQQLGALNNEWPDASDAAATEMIELIYDNSFIGALPSEFGSIGQTFSFELDTDEAIFRHIESGNYTTDFSVGTTTGDTLLPDGQSLNPTFVNFMLPAEPPSQMPSPGATGAFAVAVLIAGAARSMRVRRRARRRSRSVQ